MRERRKCLSRKTSTNLQYANRKENFQTALPNIQVKLLDGARQQFVFHLKDAIKVS